MLQDRAEPVVWAVAGSLFEVSIPEADGTSWRWANPRSGVTLVSESVHDDGHHFRFRAEITGDDAVELELRFRSQTAVRAVVMRVVMVHVAPELDAAGL